MIMAEPQLMLTAGPGIGIPPQYVPQQPGYAAPGYTMPFQGYGM